MTGNIFPVAEIKLRIWTMKVILMLYSDNNRWYTRLWIESLMYSISATPIVIIWNVGLGIFWVILWQLVVRNDQQRVSGSHMYKCLAARCVCVYGYGEMVNGKPFHYDTTTMTSRVPPIIWTTKDLVVLTSSLYAFGDVLSAPTELIRNHFIFRAVQNNNNP